MTVKGHDINKNVWICGFCKTLNMRWRVKCRECGLRHWAKVYKKRKR